MTYSVYKPTVENVVAIAEHAGFYPHANLESVIPFIKTIYPNIPLFNTDIYVKEIDGCPMPFQVGTLSSGLYAIMLDDVFTELNIPVSAESFAEGACVLAENANLTGILTQQIFPKEFNVNDRIGSDDHNTYPKLHDKYMQREVPVAKLRGYETFDDFLMSLQKKRRYNCKTSLEAYHSEFSNYLTLDEKIWITTRVNENFAGSGAENFYKSEVAMLQWLPFFHHSALNVKLHDKTTGQLVAIGSFSFATGETLVYNCFAGDRKFHGTGSSILIHLIKNLYDSGKIENGWVKNLHVGYADDFTPNPYGTYKRHCCNCEIQTLRLTATTKEANPYGEFLYPPYYNLDNGTWVTK